MYHELLNSDATQYGGSNLGNLGTFTAEEVPWDGQPWSVAITLPPLAVLYIAKA